MHLGKCHLTTTGPVHGGESAAAGCARDSTWQECAEDAGSRAHALPGPAHAACILLSPLPCVHLPPSSHEGAHQPPHPSRTNAHLLPQLGCW